MSKSDEKKQITRREFFYQGATRVLPWLAVVAFAPTLIDACTPSALTDSSDGNPDDNNASGGEDKPLSISKASGKKGDIEYVDLGLGALWARSNLGTSNPTKSGKYFNSFQTSKNKYETYPSYYGYSKGDDYAGTIYDVAYVDYGGSSGWRLPTSDDYHELMANCRLDDFEQDGVKGLLVTSKKNGNSIFFPYAGYKSWDSSDKKNKIEGSGEYGEYFSGTLRSKNDPGHIYVWKGKMQERTGGMTLDEDQYTIRAVNKGGGSSSGGGETGCNNNCSNSSTSSSCHGCGQSCSGTCTNGCDVNCSGYCTKSCGGTCTYVSAGNSCVGCATSCYNQCYSSCSGLCYTTCFNDCVNSSYL